MPICALTTCVLSTCAFFACFIFSIARATRSAAFKSSGEFTTFGPTSLCSSISACNSSATARRITPEMSVESYMWDMGLCTKRMDKSAVEFVFVPAFASVYTPLFLSITQRLKTTHRMPCTHTLMLCITFRSQPCSLPDAHPQQRVRKLLPKLPKYCPAISEWMASSVFSDADWLQFRWHIALSLLIMMEV